MSRDFNVYLKNAKKISWKDFERYAYSLGYQIRMYPSEDYSSHKGFLPFNLRNNFLEGYESFDSFLSGFEFYCNPYFPENYDPQFNALTNGAKSDLMLCASGMDAFEGLIATIFAGYLCHDCGGILYEPQTDRLYTDPESIAEKIEEEKKHLQTLAQTNTLTTHPFEGWK